MTSSQAGQEEIKNFTIKEIDFPYFSAKAKINFKNSDNDINASVSIRIRKDSLIWISLVPALGIEASRSLITKDSIFVLDRLNNQYYAYDFNSLSDKVNVTLSYTLFEAMILGNLPFHKKAEDSLSRVSKEDYYLLLQKEEKMSVENYVKVSTMKLEKIQIREKKAHKELQIVYNNFAPLNEFLFGYNSLINYTYPHNAGIQSTSIAIQYNKAEISSKPLNFPFNVPAKYTRK